MQKAHNKLDILVNIAVCIHFNMISILADFRRPILIIVKFGPEKIFQCQGYSTMHGQRTKTQVYKRLLHKLIC